MLRKVRGIGVIGPLISIGQMVVIARVRGRFEGTQSRRVSNTVSRVARQNTKMREANMNAIPLKKRRSSKSRCVS